MSGTVGGVINSLSNIASSTSNAASDISALASSGYGARGTLGVWAATLQAASFRGVPFGVYNSMVRTGRRTAVHTYPFRDEVWVEDIGLGTRIFSFRGFLVGDDVFSQRDAFLAAVETAGPGTLVHPSIGSRNCSIVDFSANERAELGRVVELEITAIQTVGTVTPVAIASTQNGILSAVSSAFTSVESDFKTYVAGPLSYGEAVAQKVVATVSVWQASAILLAGNASTLFNSVAGLVGNYGRYTSVGLTKSAASSATVASLLSDAVSNQEAVTTASQDLTLAGASLSATKTDSYVRAIQAVVDALIAGAQSPSDQIKILISLQDFNPDTLTSSAGTIGAYMATAQIGAAAAIRRVSLIGLASAVASYQPTSSNDAQSLLSNVSALFDAEIIIAADAGQDATYLAMRSLKTAVAKDLITRGANLPSLQTVSKKSNLPALSLAYYLYRDAKRADELTQRVDPIHPGLFPLEFEALSS